MRELRDLNEPMTFDPSDALLYLSFEDWENQQKEQEEELKVLVDGIEMTLPTEEELYAIYEAEAARLELTVDYYIAEFV